MDNSPCRNGEKWLFVQFAAKKTNNRLYMVFGMFDG